MASIDYDDWGLEGTAKWWWKYVLPNPESLYGYILSEAARVSGPDPSPWLQRGSAQIMESLAMFHAAANMGEREGSARLQHEAYARLSVAVKAMGHEAGLFVGVDGEPHSPINPHTRGNGGEARV